MLVWVAMTARAGLLLRPSVSVRSSAFGEPNAVRTAAITSQDLTGTDGSRHSLPAGADAGMHGVPTISRFFGIVIAMYFDGHGPPHFHARHSVGSAKVRIDTLEVIESSLGRRQLRFVLAWAELHQDESSSRTAPRPRR